MRQMGLRAPCAARRSGRRSPTRRRPARGPGEPAVPGAAAEPAVGVGFHLCRDLAGLRLRRLRHRRLRPPHRRLAGVADGACRTSSSMPWSRRCTTAVPQAAASSITAIAASQYVSIRYTERLAEAGIEPSVGSVGDSYDNALAETIIGLFKTEVIRRRGPWRSLEAVEFATLEWVDWFNNRRLLEPIGNMPPAEAEAALLCPAGDRLGGLTQQNGLRETRRGSSRSTASLLRCRDIRPPRRTPIAPEAVAVPVISLHLFCGQSPLMRCLTQLWGAGVATFAFTPIVICGAASMAGGRGCVTSCQLILCHRSAISIST